MEKEQPQNVKDLRVRIVQEVGNLSRALGQIESKESVVDEARDSFLKLSILIGEALDIKW